MEISKNEGYAVVSFNVMDINCKEMMQIAQMRDRVAYILKTHKSESSKKEYLSDGELTLIWGILGTFASMYGETIDSAFDKFVQNEGRISF